MNGRLYTLYKDILEITINSISINQNIYTDNFCKNSKNYRLCMSK